MIEIGPYMNEDGDWWVPVEGVPFRKARAEVVSCLQFGVPEEGRLAYLGKEMAWLGGEDAYDTAHQEHVLAYHFEERHQR